MAKLRKTLGSVQSETAVAYMRLIETQSKETLARWAVEYVKTEYMPIIKKHKGQDERLHHACDMVEQYLRKEIKLTELKPALADARKAAQELEENPTVQAAARAVATACAVITTSTNALGFTLYGMAAYAYDTVGLQEDVATYDMFAAKEQERILCSLRSVAVEKESNPVKVDWNCK